MADPAVQHPGVASAANKAVHTPEVLRLRRAGYSHRAIAQRLGISAMTAKRYLDAALVELAKEQRAEAEQLRAFELARLDGLLVSIEQLLDRGDLGAIDRALKIVELRCKMLGLFAPTVVDWRGEAAEAGVDPDALLQNLVSTFRAALAGGPAGGGAGDGEGATAPGAEPG